MNMALMKINAKKIKDIAVNYTAVSFFCFPKERIIMKQDKQTCFQIITKEVQKQFEKECGDKSDETPEICGYYGRACRCLGSLDGADRMLCWHCPLADYAAEKKDE